MGVLVGYWIVCHFGSDMLRVSVSKWHATLIMLTAKFFKFNRVRLLKYDKANLESLNLGVKNLTNVR